MDLLCFLIESQCSRGARPMWANFFLSLWGLSTVDLFSLLAEAIWRFGNKAREEVTNSLTKL